MFNMNTDIGSGWLSPQGEFFPCKDGEHSDKARSMGTTECSLEYSSWIKIYNEGSDWYGDRMTREQHDFLENHGFDDL